MATQRIETGLLGGTLPYMAVGKGEPLVMVRGLSASNSNPRGVGRWSELRAMRPYAKNFKVYSVSRNPHDELSTDMHNYAAQYAEAMQKAFKRPVHIMGFSTGGSLAQQIAFDYPQVVKKLVLVAAAYRLSDAAKRAQAASATWFGKGDARRAFAALAPLMTTKPAVAKLLAGLLWLTTPLGGKMNTPQMAALLWAEDGFNAQTHLSRIAAPTILVAGAADTLYTPELARQTAAAIPDCQLVILPKANHPATITSSKTVRVVGEFLARNGS